MRVAGPVKFAKVRESVYEVVAEEEVVKLTQPVEQNVADEEEAPSNP